MPSALVLAREALWLAEVVQGSSLRSIAAREGLSPRRIAHGVRRARECNSRMQDSSIRDIPEASPDQDSAWEDPMTPPRLVPLFPITPFTPRSECGHKGPIRAGSVFCCMVCSRSGMDGHPALRRDPRTDPRPDPRPPAPRPGRAETRKQRRQRIYLARLAALMTAPRPLKPGPAAATS